MPENKNNKIILIGSSTGGPQIVESILKDIDPGKFSVLIAQHMPEGFTAKWAERLDRVTPFQAAEAADGDRALPGRAYVAPGNRHLLLSERGEGILQLSDAPLVNRFRPSIDVLFGSALLYPPERIYAVILTGMCYDGVMGIKQLKDNGSVTIAQDAETSAVFGMNKEAIDKGGISYVMSPGEMVNYFNRI